MAHSLGNVVTEGKGNSTASRPRCSVALLNLDDTQMIQEARSCLPVGLLSYHLSGKRRCEQQFRLSLSPCALSLQQRRTNSFRRPTSTVACMVLTLLYGMMMSLPMLKSTLLQ